MSSIIHCLLCARIKDQYRHTLLSQNKQPFKLREIEMPFPRRENLFAKLFPRMRFFKRTISTRFKIYRYFLFTIVFTSHSKHCLQTTYDSPSSRNISAAKVLFFNPQLQFSGPDSGRNDCLIQSEKRDLGGLKLGRKGFRR